MKMDKIKITQKEFDELYELEEDLTQSNIEDKIDTVLSEKEQEHDDKLKELWEEA